jgi:hypothetical protein
MMKSMKNGRGGRLSKCEMDENLSHQKKWLKTVKKMGCPERLPVLIIEVVILGSELLILGYPHLTPPTGRWGFHLRVGSRIGVQFAKISLFP